MAHLLSILETDNVVVCCTRWFGGVHLCVPEGYQIVNIPADKAAALQWTGQIQAYQLCYEERARSWGLPQSVAHVKSGVVIGESQEQQTAKQTLSCSYPSIHRYLHSLLLVPLGAA